MMQFLNSWFTMRLSLGDLEDSCIELCLGVDFKLGATWNP